MSFASDLRVPLVIVDGSSLSLPSMELPEKRFFFKTSVEQEFVCLGDGAVVCSSLHFDCRLLLVCCMTIIG